MPIYRVNFPLSMKDRIIPTGAVDRLRFIHADTRDILERKGRISRASTPPLGILPGWKTRATRMLKAGIVTVEDLVDADAEELAMAIKGSTITIRNWQEEVMKWVSVEGHSSG